MPPDTSAERQLADENARLSRELELARSQVDSLRKELQSFVYAAGHDLKQSLRSIGSYSQLLLRSAPLDQQSQEYAHFMIDGVRSATTLIEQLVILSRAGSSTARSAVDLKSCAHTALFKLRELVKRTGANVNVADLPQVSVNQADFDQVFERLIENAILYADRVDAIVEISSDEGDEGHIVFVRDNGPGIDPKFHEEVFRPFKRLHGREIPGAGMGLSISRKIVESHGGRLWVGSAGTGGSVFQFSLPY